MMHKTHWLMCLVLCVGCSLGEHKSNDAHNGADTAKSLAHLNGQKHTVQVRSLEQRPGLVRTDEKHETPVPKRRPLNPVLEYEKTQGDQSQSDFGDEKKASAEAQVDDPSPMQEANEPTETEAAEEARADVQDEAVVSVQTEDVPASASEGSADEAPEATPVEVEYSERTVVSLAPARDDTPVIKPRPRRRMNIDQLARAMTQVSGGIEWIERIGRNDVNLFENLASTLGKPDYRERTDEELDPTVLFQKFLGDASRSVCSKMLTADLAHETAIQNGESSDWEPRLLIKVNSTETLASAPHAFRDNVRVLVERFHSRRLDVDAPGLENWHWFVLSALHVTQDPKQAWLGLCVALFSHPDFYTF